MKLRLADQTQNYLDGLSDTLPQATLLSGPKGIGLATIAKHIAQQNGKLLELVEPELKTSSSSVASITVEKIRNLYSHTSVKFDTPHFIIIDNAETMNHVAQNALLKLLEEPGSSIHFILTTHSPDSLLTTIRSRAQAFVAPQISEIESRRLLTSLGVKDEMDIRRLLYIAAGLPAELTRLASSKSEFAVLSQRVQQARDFVQGNTYDKLVIVQSLKDDRSGTVSFIDMVVLLLRRSLTSSANISTVELIDKLITASAVIQANGNARLQLIRAVV